MTFWETVDMGIKVTVAWHRFRPFKRLCTCTGVRICFQITFWTTQYTYWLSLFSVLLTKSLIFLWIQTAHTDLISVNRFSFQMQGFSWLFCFFNFVCKAYNVQNFLLTINQVILFVFLKDVWLCDCGLLFLVTKDEVVHKKDFWFA